MNATVNARQLAKLQDIARVPGIRQLSYQSTSDVATLKALKRRGLIRLRYVNSRAWDASLTDEGLRVLDEENNRSSVMRLIVLQESTHARQG